jgi:hypothetical protein
MPNRRRTHPGRELPRTFGISSCREVIGNHRRRLSEMAYTGLQLLQFLDRLLAGERPLNVPITM